MRWREFCEDKIVDLREAALTEGLRGFMDLYLILFVHAKKQNKKQKEPNFIWGFSGTFWEFNKFLSPHHFNLFLELFEAH